jgi:hypothetical protein
MGKLLDAATTLIGWVNFSAEPHVEERVIAANTTVKISTPLDAADAFTFVAAHPGHSTPVTFTLEVAPEKRDGTIGTWVQVTQVAIPAPGGRVEAPLNGSLLTVDAADADDVGEFSVYYARATMSDPSADPVSPAGAYAGLTF